MSSNRDVEQAMRRVMREGKSLQDTTDDVRTLLDAGMLMSGVACYEPTSAGLKLMERIGSGEDLKGMTAQEYVDRLNQQSYGPGVLVCHGEWKTGLDVARSLAIEEHSDTYKDLYGSRPRHVNYDEMTLTQIEQANRALHEDLEEALEYDEYDDSMDGDHESALASAGFGTDEDYGDYGDGW